MTSQVTSMAAAGCSFEFYITIQEDSGYFEVTCI